MRTDLNAYRTIREATIEELDYIANIPHLRTILEAQLDNINVGRGYYATDECLTNKCVYPRIWFGKCMAQYRDQVAITHLRKILT